MFTSGYADLPVIGTTAGTNANTVALTSSS